MRDHRKVPMALMLITAVVLASACKDEQKATSEEPQPTATTPDEPGAEPAEEKPEPGAKPKMTNLLKAPLTNVEDTEVVVSKVVIPPDVEVPKHYHPGQEFVYLEKGTVDLKIEGEEERPMEAGDVAVVPVEAKHTAATRDEEATAIVFRVHIEDKPVRYIIKPDGTEVPKTQ